MHNAFSLFLPVCSSSLFLYTSLPSHTLPFLPSSSLLPLSSSRTRTIFKDMSFP